MRANNNQVNLSDNRQKDYQRQQERLKAMAHSADKDKQVSADMMINSLLRNSFKNSLSVQPHVESQDHCQSELPLWLHCESAMVPSQYNYLWSFVQSTPDFADTQKVSQLLLTSGLHLDMLGYIWNLSNKAVPGQLTKQEFYIVLALVGLAQTGCTFNNLSVLKLLPAPSIPVLQFNMLKTQPFSPSGDVQELKNSPAQPLKVVHNMLQSDKYNNKSPIGICANKVNDSRFSIKKNEIKKESVETVFNSSSKPIKINEIHLIESSKGPYKNSNFPCIGSSPTAEIEDDFTEFQSVPVENMEVCEKVNNMPHDTIDDFTEFQSANTEHVDPFETVVITQKREIPRIPLPKSFTGKLTTLKSNVLKISPESERKLKVLSQPESLASLPESKISTNNKVSTSISVLGSNHGIGSRLANHSLSAKADRSKHHRHHKIKINANALAATSSDEDIILGVKTTNLENLIPKCCPKKSASCKTFVLKETKIRNEDTVSTIGDQTAQEPNSGEKTRQIEIPLLGTFNETVLPTQTNSEPSTVDLISVQEDKYSALREIELDLNGDKPQSTLEETNDDFGDFLSAEIPPPPPPPPPLITSTQPPAVTVPDSLLDTKEEAWGTWNFSVETNSTFTLNIVENQAEVSPLKNDLLDSLNLLNLSECDVKPFMKPSSVLQQNVFSQSTLNNILIDKSDVLSEEKYNISLQIKPEPPNSQPNTEFWDFLSSEVKPTTDNTISRHGSLPNLNLKVSSAEETEQETIWRKCLESCYNLILEGFEIFNNITVKSLLDEVFATPQTSEYINCLNIVYHISKRINQNCSEFLASQHDLDRLWGRLQELCIEYNIKLKEDEDCVADGKSQCSICHGYTSHDVVVQGPNSFHPSCANLWINVIESNLPYSS